MGHVTRRGFLALAGALGAGVGRTYFDLGASWQRRTLAGLWLPRIPNGALFASTTPPSTETAATWVWWPARDCVLDAEAVRLARDTYTVWGRSGVALVRPSRAGVPAQPALATLDDARALWQGGAGWRVRG